VLTVGYYVVYFSGTSTIKAPSCGSVFVLVTKDRLAYSCRYYVAASKDVILPVLFS